MLIAWRDSEEITRAAFAKKLVYLKKDLLNWPFSTHLRDGFHNSVLHETAYLVVNLLNKYFQFLTKLVASFGSFILHIPGLSFD